MDEFERGIIARDLAEFDMLPKELRLAVKRGELMMSTRDIWMLYLRMKPDEILELYGQPHKVVERLEKERAA